MADIARQAGVSKNAVSLALKGDNRIPVSTRERIARIAGSMNYQRDAAVGELMGRIRRGQTGHGITLALVNANLDRKAFRAHPTIPAYVEGCRRRAGLLGYGLDEFWMWDPALDAPGFLRMFRARGIRGVILVGMMKENRVPEHFLPVLEKFPTVVTGVRTRDPAFSFACVDHHALALHAFERAVTLGYRRPGLVIDRQIDNLVEGRFTAGFLVGQMRHPEVAGLKPFYEVSEAKKRPMLFQEWMQGEAPDVIFTLYNVVMDWVARSGLKVPEDVGLIQLEWRSADPRWAGMHQHNDVVGEAAMDMLVSKILGSETGAPAFPRAHLVGASWVGGATVNSGAGVEKMKSDSLKQKTLSD